MRGTHGSACAGDQRRPDARPRLACPGHGCEEQRRCQEQRNDPAAHPPRRKSDRRARSRRRSATPGPPATGLGFPASQYPLTSPHRRRCRPGPHQLDAACWAVGRLAGACSP
eukprot:6087527-Alexandrium_andersonii.AAC.1